MIVFSVMEMFKRLEREDAELRKRHNEDPYFLITPPVNQINQLFIKISYFNEFRKMLHMRELSLISWEWRRSEGCVIFYFIFTLFIFG